MINTTVPHFHGWSNVPEEYKTKTELRRMGLKPIYVEKYDATLKGYQQGRWKDFVLYLVDNCIPIKKIQVNEVEMTDSNIAEALYVINKSAKISRDTKVNNYYKRNYSLVSRSKTRQNKLYDLKNDVIEKLLSEGKMVTLGYHTQNSHAEIAEINFLLLHQFMGYTFHEPCSKEYTAELNYLGEIEKISSEMTRKTTLKFNESANLLERYINQ